MEQLGFYNSISLFHANNWNSFSLFLCKILIQSVCPYLEFFATIFVKLRNKTTRVIQLKYPSFFSISHPKAYNTAQKHADSAVVEANENIYARVCVNSILINNHKRNFVKIYQVSLGALSLSVTRTHKGNCNSYKFQKSSSFFFCLSFFHFSFRIPI